MAEGGGRPEMPKSRRKRPRKAEQGREPGVEASLLSSDLAQVYVIRSADGRVIGTSNIVGPEFKQLHREVLALLTRRGVPRES